MRSFFKNYAGTLLLLSALIVAYELATDVYQWLEPVLFPGLSRILPALAESLPELWEGLQSSMLLLLPAYGLALLLGISLGIGIFHTLVSRQHLVPINLGAIGIIFWILIIIHNLSQSRSHTARKRWLAII